MATFASEVKGQMAAPPAEVFALLTDAARLPEWNARIIRVVDVPPQLVVGAEWVVRLRVLGSEWNSRSVAQTVDPGARVFAHRTQTDDGNPSYALWTWQVGERNGGAEVTVRWDINPKTFWRRRLFAHIRHRQLQKEVRRSLAAADRLLAAEVA